MADALESVIDTHLELHFGRLAHCSPDASEHPALIEAIAHLVGHISEHLLQGGTNTSTDTALLCRVFDRRNALPSWLVNKGIVRCGNNRHKLERALRELLENPFNHRRFIDYSCGEMLYRWWQWSTERDKRRWPLTHIRNACANRFCQELNAEEYVIALEGDFVDKADKQREAYRWYVRSIGTVTLVDYATSAIFDHTARLLEGRYKTSFILDVFKDLFKKAYTGTAFDRFGVLVLGDAPKTFALAEYRAALENGGHRPMPRERGVIALLHHLMGRFDDAGAREQPETRFRLGNDPPEALLDKVGAAFWLRRTLDAVKRIQQNKPAPTRGLLVEERTVLDTAREQQSLLYFRLFDDPTDSAINPCRIQAVTETSMVLHSPQGNRLNEARPGQEVHGYFSVTGNGQKNTFCDFRSNILAVSPGDATCRLIEIGIPATFELTRRSHKRLRLPREHLAAFELSSPPPDADWSLYTSLKRWPAPLCIIPDGASHCHIKDLSAGGLMLEIHHDAPAYGYLTEANRDYPLLAYLHLAGGIGTPELKLGLRLEIKRIRDIPQVCRKYVGFQFTEAGELRNDHLVRLAAVGKDGIFLINDWIFRNTLGR